MGTTVVLLEIQVKPECVEEVKAYLKEALPDTRAYNGCQGIDIYGNLDESSNLVFYERWDSREHYQKYLNWRTERGDFENLSSKLASPASIRYYDRIDV